MKKAIAARIKKNKYVQTAISRLDKDAKHLVRGGTISMFFKIVGMLCAYGFAFVVNHKLGIEAYGEYSLAVSFLRIVFVIGRFGFDIVILRLVSKYCIDNEQHKIQPLINKILKFIIPINLLSSALIFVFAPQIANLLLRSDPTTSHSILAWNIRIVSIGILPWVLVYLNAELFRAKKQIGKYSFLQDAGVQILSLILLLFALVAGIRNDYFLVAIQVASLGFLCITSFVLIRRLKTEKARGKIKVEGMKKLIEIAIPIATSAALGVILYQADTMLLGVYMTKKDVGIYSTILKISQVVSVPLMAINAANAPQIANYYEKGEPKSMRKVINQNRKLNVLFTLPIFLGFFLLAGLTLKFFNIEPISTSRAGLRIIVSSAFVASIFGPVGYALQMTERYKAYRNLVALSVITNIILDIVLIPIWGIVGAAVANFCGMLVMRLIATQLVYSTKKQ